MDCQAYLVLAVTENQFSGFAKLDIDPTSGKGRKVFAFRGLFVELVGVVWLELRKPLCIL